MYQIKHRVQYLQQQQQQQQHCTNLELKVISRYYEWSQIGIRSKFVLFDSKICDSIDSKGQKIFEKFDENLFDIRSIRFDSNYRVQPNFQKLEFVRNSIVIRLIQKVKKI